MGFEADSKVLLIGNEKEFLVKSVANVMERRGFSTYFCEPNINSVNEKGKDIKIYLIFIDSAESMKELFVYLKDTAFDKKIEIALVGENLEIKEAAKYLQKENIGMSFSRPVDAKQIGDGLEELDRIAGQKSERKRILIVDDDPEYLRRTQSILHNHYKIYIANSGASALMLLAKHKVDLILLDYLMPVLDGPKVLETLKNEPDTADIPVIFLSGQTDARSVTKAMTLGSENYISKALAAKELAAMIADFFAKKEWEKRSV